MNKKTFHALLLSLVMIVGVMTINDAYAQTNTERLITVIGTTDDTNQKVTQLESLWDNFGSMFTPITDALNELADNVAMISSDIDGLSDDVMGISASVDNLEAKLAELESTSDMNAQYHADHVAALSESLPSLQDKIDTVSQDINIDQIINKIDAISTQVNSFSDELSTLQGDVESIQAELGLVKQVAVVTTGTPPSDLNSPDTDPVDVLLSWYGHDLYGRDLTPADVKDISHTDKQPAYTAEYYFSCESDVFVGKVTSTIGDSRNADTGAVTTYNDMEVKYWYKDTNDNNNLKTKEVKLPNPIYSLKGLDTTDREAGEFYTTTLQVNNKYLFHSDFTGSLDTNPSKPTIYDNSVDFELMELKAGEKLTFKSTSIDPMVLGSDHDKLAYPLVAYLNTTMNKLNATYFDDDYNEQNLNNVDVLLKSATNSEGYITKAQLGAGVVYTVDVDYYTEADDAKCMITPGETMLNKVDQTLPFGIAPSDDKLISSYEETVACDLNRVKITDVAAELAASPGFNVHVTMDFKIGDDTKAKFTFDENNKAVLEDPNSLPIEFAGTDLTVSGNIVSGASAIVEITYDTVMGGECTAQ